MGKPSSSFFGLSAVFLVLLGLNLVNADLPVHCVRHQVVGTWKFELSQPSAERSDCGHQHPDAEESQPALDKFTGATSLTVALNNPNEVVVQGPSSLLQQRTTIRDSSTSLLESEPGAGWWTMIYDEGFDVHVGDLSLFTFSKFTILAGDLGPSVTRSDCARTEVGWYRNHRDNTWGCFLGVKMNGNAPAPEEPPPVRQSAIYTADGSADAPSAQALLVAKQSASSALRGALLSGQGDDTDASPLGDSVSFLELFSRSVTADVSGDSLAALEGSGNPISAWHSEEAVSLSQLQDVVSHVNSAKAGWQAAVYPEVVGRTFQQINHKAGIPRSGKRRGGLVPGGEDLIQEAAHVSRARRHRRSIKQHVASDLPTTWDWRNAEGVNYIEESIDQADCGSCYTVATVRMYNARWRIAQKNPGATGFSPNFPLFCSEFNQGCKGGYPYLVAKWTSEIGLLPEHCATYNPMDGTCKISCDLSKSTNYTVSSFGYVGGYYGASDEESIMREVRAAGPVVVSIEPTPSFMVYRAGVYSEVPLPHSEWIKVDHAVLVVGWGEERDPISGEDIKFWVVQNSWGPTWGEGGFFRIRRGVDESGIEAEGVFANVKQVTQLDAANDHFFMQIKAGGL